LDELQAAVLRVKLKYLDEWNQRRRRIADVYREGLAGVDQVSTPQVPSWADPVWHVFVIRHPERDRLQQHLSAAGVGTIIHYPCPPHLQTAYAELGYTRGAFPIAEEMADEVLSLPMGPHVSESQAAYVIETIADFAASIH
jgi:dTDP-4-amino-4,6-dideoxygalactose transaminase